MKISVLSLLCALVLAACGGGGDTPPTLAGSKEKQPQQQPHTGLPDRPAPVFVERRAFSFNAHVVPETLAYERIISLYDSWSHSRQDNYAIQTEDDLSAFNRTVSAHELVSLDQLATHTYFLIRGPHCPNRYEVAGSSNTPSGFSIALDLFTFPGSVCAAVMVDEYSLFKARKHADAGP